MKSFNFKIISYFFVIALILIIAFFLFNDKKQEDVKVSLIGDEIKTISVNDTYEDEGINLTINDKEVTLDDVAYETTNNINNSIVGDYQVNYNVKYADKEYNLKRVVSVIDNIKPVITPLNETVSTSTCKTKKLDNLRYYAIDNYDGVITNKVNTEIIDNSYKLSVTDSSGNYTEVFVPIENKSTYAIELNGNLVNYVKFNSEFNDPGVTVTNICGKKVNVPYITENNVNTSEIGEYKIKYTIENENISNERIVYVYDPVKGISNSSNDEKVIYLTFDDGPGQYTETLLDILKREEVKATFFVTNQFSKYVPLIERENKEGHVVALHTLTHSWNIYRSFENYYKDFNDMNDVIEKYTGVRANIFRFPGGSSNTISKSKSSGIMSYNVSKMNELGYTYFDWNVDSEDAAGASSEKILRNLKNGIENRNYSVILMHDIKKNTIDVIEEFIIYAKEKGYTFKTLDSLSPTVHHHVNN